jgi:PAS domain S-box-containing protein
LISSTNYDFERHRLSKREDAILSYAIEGLTDIQIALKLDISQSTVNSYWVRIRGKLGQLSRTELVALALKQQHQEEMKSLLAQSEKLERQAAQRNQDDAHLRRAELYHAALDAMPEAVLVCDEEGTIAYANPRLAAMFGYESRSLIGQPVATLIPERLRSPQARSINEFLADPHPVRIGSDRAVYARRRDGREFRVMVLLDSAATSNGPVTTCIVRDFVNEIETRRSFMAASDSFIYPD